MHRLVLTFPGNPHVVTAKGIELIEVLPVLIIFELQQ